MPFSVRIQDFQSIEDVSIEVDGLTVITGPNNSGKALRNGTLVSTPMGWKPVEDLLPGDLVISGEGTPTTVLGVYPQGKRLTWRIGFDDGRSVVVDGEHLWTTSIASDRFNSLRKPKFKEHPQRWKTLTTIQIFKRVGASPKGQMRPSIPTAGPVQYIPQKIKLDPYLLGVLLGDGSMSVSRGGVGANECRRLGITVTSEHKFVPDTYKYNTVDVRLAVLQGLLDTDGTVEKSTGGVTFSTSSSKLADDVAELVYSLGGKVRRRIRHPHYRYLGERREGLPSHSLCIRLLGVDLFRLTRKLSLVRAPKRRNDPLIVSISPAGLAECTCIEVDHPSSLYQIEGHLVTHNTALIRAIFGAFTNARGIKFVRHGKTSSKVELVFSDGRRLFWEKGEKVNRYELDGKALNRVGHGAPPETATLGVMPVEAAGRELWPQFAHQFVGQVFLLDEPGSVLAEAVANVDKVGVLNESLRLAQSDRRSAATELKIRLEDVVKHEAALLRFEGFDDAVGHVQKAETLRSQVARDRELLDQVRGLKIRWVSATESVKALLPVRSLPIVDDVLVERVKKTRSALDWASLTATRLRRAQEERDQAEDATQKVKSLTLPDPQPVQEALQQLEAVTGLRSRLRSMQDSVDALRSSLVKIQADHTTSEAEVQSLFGEAGQCPFCGAQHEANSC
jgi:hypothetical protein